jgi:SAM-dependent methyltransferase
MEAVVFSWSKLYAFRKEIKRRWKSVWSLPVAKKRQDIIFQELQKNTRFLDVGAHTRELGNFLSERCPGFIYKTMDIDKENDHDYYSLDEIDGEFDFINISEVIEHIDFEDGVLLLRKIHSILAPSGKLYLSTPNLHHPNRFWDIDHKTPYRYDEIAAVLLSLGFQINSIYRIYNDSFFKRFFRLYFAAWLHRYLDVDFAKSIAVVAQKR